MPDDDLQFDRNAQPSSIAPCANPCQTAKGADDQLSSSAHGLMEFYNGFPEQATGMSPGDDGPMLLPADLNPCQEQALTLGPTLRRFNRYREALPYARATFDMNQLGDQPGTTPVSSKAPCLTRLPDTADALCDALKIPRGSLKDTDLVNNETGFRAVIYKDQASGRLILVSRDTEATSLVDWKTNTRNGDNQQTDQYSAMQALTATLVDQNVKFDMAGYSKGGGLAQVAGLINTDPQSKVMVFNSAGIPDRYCDDAGIATVNSLMARTSAFSAEDDFLTYMNNTTDPEQRIENAKFLRRELAGDNRYLIHPMKIDHRNPEHPDGEKDPDFKSDLKKYFEELDSKIQQMESDYAAGLPVAGFPPVRAFQKEVIPDSMDKDFSKGFLPRARGPNLSKLNQHLIKNVLDPMESTYQNDRDSLSDFISNCGQCKV